MVTTELIDSNSLEIEAARFFYWMSPNFDVTLFLILLPFMLIPFYWIWLKIIYPPGKYYAFVPYNRNDTATVFNATEGLFRKLDEYTEFVPFQLFKQAFSGNNA